MWAHARKNTHTHVLSLFVGPSFFPFLAFSLESAVLLLSSRSFLLGNFLRAILISLSKTSLNFLSLSFRFSPFHAFFCISALSLSYTSLLLPLFHFVSIVYFCAPFDSLPFLTPDIYLPSCGSVTCLRLNFRQISFNFFNSSTLAHNRYIGRSPLYLLRSFPPSKSSLVEITFLNLATDNMTLNDILL